MKRPWAPTATIVLVFGLCAAAFAAPVAHAPVAGSPVEAIAGVLHAVPPQWHAAIGRYLDAPTGDAVLLKQQAGELAAAVAAGDSSGETGPVDVLALAPEFARRTGDDGFVAEKLIGLKIGLAKPLSDREDARRTLTEATRRAFEHLSPEKQDRLRRKIEDIAAALGVSADEGDPEAPVVASPRSEQRRLPAHWKLQPREDAVMRAFRTMPKVWKDQLDRYYNGRFMDDFLKRTQYSVSAAHVFGARWERGDDNARALVSLGFRAERDEIEGGYVLRPPASLAIVFSRMARRMRELVGTGALKEEETIEASLVFVSRRLNESSGHDFLFVRPGRDPWPPEALWVLDEADAPLPDRAWFQALSEGKMPLPTSRFLVHDLTHMTEFFRAEIARQTRLFAKSWPATGRVSADRRLESAWELRNYIFSEWLSIPDLRADPEIRGTIPEWFHADGPQSFEAAVSSIRALTPDARKRRAGRLIDHAEKILLRFGGGLRDHFSLQAQDSDAEIFKRVAGALVDSDQPLPWVIQGEVPEKVGLARETLHGLVREIRVIRDIRYQPGDLRAKGYDAASFEPILEIKPGRRNAALDRLLSDRLARVETALYRAVRLKITPEELYREARNASPEPDSLVDKYFKSFLPPESLHRQAFAPAPR